MLARDGSGSPDFTTAGVVSREFKVFHGTHGFDCRMLETAAFEFGDSNRRRRRQY